MNDIPEFDITITYGVGAKVSYDGLIYRFLSMTPKKDHFIVDFSLGVLPSSDRKWIIDGIDIEQYKD